MPNLKYHPMLNKIIKGLDFSKINSNPNLKKFYSSVNHPGYAGDTIFEGRCSGNNLWLSVNIIEGSEYLFIHTTLGIATGSNIQNELNNFPDFAQSGPKTTLIRVGLLNMGVQALINEIENKIFPYLKLMEHESNSF